MCGLTTTILAGNIPTEGTGLWSIQSGEGGKIDTVTSPTSTFSGTAGTTYVLRWTISDYPCTSTDEVTITFNALPVPGISVTDNSGIANNDGIICEGESATLTATGGTSYNWSTGETTAGITKNTAGIYTVTVTDVNGCQNTADTVIIVNALPVPGISVTDNSGLANNDGIICEGESATLTATGGTSYSWSTGETTAGITKNTAGIYTVTVTDVNGCQNTADTVIIVNALPVPGISVTDNSGIANNDGVICEGESATLTATGGTSYSWSTGETTAGITKNTAGIYTVTVTDVNGCQNTADTVIIVNALPVPGISVTDNSGIANNDGIICEGADVPP